jgi:tight adherence protein B
MNGLQVGILAGGMFVTVIAVLFAFSGEGGGKIGKRAARLSARLNHVVTSADLQLRREMGDQTSLDRIVRRLMPQPEVLRQRLRRTGRNIGLGAYGVTCLVVAAVAGVAGIVAQVGLLFGLWLPYLATGFLAKRRVKKIGNLLPEAIGLMVRSIKSGLPITEAFVIIGREMPDPLGGEFRQLCDQVRIGQSLEQALNDMAKRTGVQEMKFLNSTLAVQRETGGNLAETLENLDNILRRRRQMRLKVKALSSEARASAMIIGSLPFIMGCVLSVADRGYLTILFTDHLGNEFLGGAICSMTMGVGVMVKMVRFDI